MRSNRILSAALVACGAIGLSTSAYATNGYQLIGIGAYQKGMGGAVTANPGSAMTAVTNPAGMAAIGNRGDFSTEFFHTERTADFSDTDAESRDVVDQGGDSVDSDTENYGVPAVGWTAPVSEGSDFYFGGGAFGTAGLGADYGQTRFGADTQNPGSFGGMDFTGFSSISFFQMAPTLAWNATERLKLGVAANMDYQLVSFRQQLNAGINPTGPNGNLNPGGNAGPIGFSNPQTGQNTFLNFDLGNTAPTFGFGLSLGALYEINEMWTVGVSYKSPQEFAESEYNLREGDIQNFPDGNGGLVTSKAGTYEMDLDYPQQAALGVKFTPTDRLNVSADIKWINWSDTLDDLEVTGDFQVGRASPDGTPTPNQNAGNDTSGNAALDPGWDDQIVYAIGVDYAVIPDKLNLRAGYNYAETPIEKDDVFSNIVLPAMVEQHLSLGATYVINDSWDVSFAYMKAFENDETGSGDIPDSLTARGFGEDSRANIDLSETTYTVNLGYRF
ncbi:OmpP1/FadL family transporter [Thiohalorhabdus sp.]|uniref:OmpP1/FadL family transporter n=1 Tax=Thiohalorhabdus sp. TaxID=3094134 RepID=UPI002FC2DADD